MDRQSSSLEWLGFFYSFFNDNYYLKVDNSNKLKANDLNSGEVELTNNILELDQISTFEDEVASVIGDQFSYLLNLH